MEISKKPLPDQMRGQMFFSNILDEAAQTRRNDQPSNYMAHFNPAVQSELSPDDALAAMVVEAVGGLVAGADAAINLASLFCSDNERQAWATALNRRDDAHALVIAWSGDDAPLLCPRAAHALSRFRMGLESLGYAVRGFAASVHDNLGMPSLHGVAWAMVIADASLKIVQELMERTWRDAREAVAPHRCGWCSWDNSV